MQWEKKVSVIVPCYNSAPYLKTCLESLVAQIYENIEIVCVNDGSTDHTETILQNYAEIYGNIKIITLPQNRGLFWARIAGVQNADGDYILFVDSDDRVTRNWIGALLRKAEESNADLVLGDMRKFGDVRNKKINPKISSFQNLDPVRLRDIDTDGAGILNDFMNVHGLCSNYHYVWNKLIRRDLWENSYLDLIKLSETYPHLVMGEDIAFSVTFFCHAKHVVNIHNEYYIYCIHNSQSVNTDNIGKFHKNVNDLKAVFAHVKYLLNEYRYWDIHQDHYKMLQQRYGMIYFRLARELSLPKNIVQSIRDDFLLDEIEDEKEIKSEYFFSLMTNTQPIDDVYHKLIDLIYSKDIKIISFDVFDTLVVRPFGYPSDIFVLLNMPFRKIFGLHAYVDFSSQRKVAEDTCHKIQKSLRPGAEEPTLDDIYDVLSQNYGYDREKLRQIEQIEMENEVKYAYGRKFAIDLFEQAKSAGKKVILSSDMYLPRECIVSILDKCGIVGYDELFLSCEMHLTKHSGRMYPAIIRHYKDFAKPNQILHIGDNYDSDVKRAKEAGIKAQHCPAALGLLQGRNPGIFTGNSFDKIYKVADRYTDMDMAYYGFSGIRNVCAVVANKIFDFPYVSFNKDSDLNGDPRFIGYYPVGTHIFAIARWLIKKVRGKGVRQIHFAARDGYLIKQAYDILAEGLPDVPRSNYIRLSRKALAIADIRKIEDMHSIVHKMNFIKQSPDTIHDLFLPVLSENAKRKYDSFRDSNPVFCEATFSERGQFDQYMVLFFKDYLSDADFETYQKHLSEYFKSIIAPDDVFFDIGYSGRVELALYQLLGYKIKSYYIHTNNDSFYKRNSIAPFENETFYNYKPNITGVMREHILSEMCPSTIGYNEVDGKFELIFDEYKINYPTYFATKMVQDYALEFVSDMKKHFGKSAIDLYCRDEDLSRPFEYYLHFSRSFDRNIFADSEFEDDFGEGHNISGLEFWNKALGRIHSEGGHNHYIEPSVPKKVLSKPKWMRALYYFLFDHNTFREKLKRKVKSKK